MIKVAWSDPAVQDLESIYQHILKDSEYYAKQFVGRLVEAAEGLEIFPNRGRVVPEARDLDGVRELIFEATGSSIVWKPQGS